MTNTSSVGPPAAAVQLGGRTTDAGRTGTLCSLVLSLVDVELVEVRGRAVPVEVDGRRRGAVDEYRVQQLPLQAGDRLMFITDGVLDRNASVLNLEALMLEEPKCIREKPCSTWSLPCFTQPGGGSKTTQLRVTGQIARIELQAGTATIVNAGHPRPLRLRDGSVESVECVLSI